MCWKSYCSNLNKSAFFVDQNNTTKDHEAGARYPVKDPEYSQELERKHLEWIEMERLPQLERQRIEFLSKVFDPVNNW
jgi:hypothetical protein